MRVVHVAPNGSVWTLYSDRFLGRLAEYLCGNVDGICYNIYDAMIHTKEDIGEHDVYGVSFVSYESSDDHFTLAGAETSTSGLDKKIYGKNWSIYGTKIIHRGMEQTNLL